MKLLIAISFLLTFFSSFGQGRQEVIRIKCNEAWTTDSFYALLQKPINYTIEVDSTYPVLIFLHGAGETGTTSGHLSRIYTSSTSGGPAYFINQATFPDSFRVGGTGAWKKFLILSPQAPGWSASGNHLKFMIRDMIARYRVDINRIYITGLSAGGDGVMQYAGKNGTTPEHLVAGIVPMSAAYGRSTASMGVATRDTNYFWAFGSNSDSHGTATEDNMIYVQDTVTALSFPNSPRFTQYVGGHCCWNSFYNPTYRESISGDSMNIYQWMLTKNRTYGISGGSGGGSGCSGTTYTLGGGGTGYAFTEDTSNYFFNPGDIIEIDSATSMGRTYIYLSGLRGSAECPIIIRNKGFVQMSSGLSLVNCQNVVITGTGTLGSTVTDYGIKIQQFWNDTITALTGDQSDYYISNINGGRYVRYANSGGAGINISGASQNIRINHVEITKSKYGFQIKDDEECDTTLNYPNGTIEDIEIDSCYIHDTESQGMYIGTTEPNNSTVLSRVVNCSGTNYYFNPGRMGNLRIHDNLIRNTGRGGIQVSVAEIGMSLIYNNVIRRTGRQTDDGQGGGITLGSYTKAIVFNNDIDSTLTYGGIDYGTKTRWYNNIISHSGYTVHGRPDIDTNYSLIWARNFVKESRRSVPWFPGVPIDSIEMKLFDNDFSNATAIILGGLTYSFAIGGTAPSVSDWTTRNYHYGNTYNTTTISSGSTRIENTVPLTLNNTETPIQPAVNAGRDFVQIKKVTGTDTTITGGADGLGGATITSYLWTQVAGPNTATFSDATNPVVTINNLIDGYYIFKLTATDSNGQSDRDTMVMEVSNGATGGGGIIRGTRFPGGIIRTKN